MMFYDQEFIDRASGRTCCVRQIDGEDWMCYRHPDGQWVTWRQLTPEDRDVLGLQEAQR